MSSEHRRITSADYPDIVDAAEELANRIEGDADFARIIDAQNLLLKLLRPIHDRPLEETIELPRKLRRLVYRLWEKAEFALLHQSVSAQDEILELVRQLCPGNNAASDPSEVEQAEGTDERTRQERIAKLPRAIRRAFLAFEAVARKKEKGLEDLKDHEAHKLLMEEGVPDDADDRGKLIDYKPPKSVETFRKYLSKARRALGEPKYTSRRGRAHGKSIVRQDQIEPSDNDDE